MAESQSSCQDLNHINEIPEVHVGIDKQVTIVNCLVFDQIFESVIDSEGNI